MHLYLAETMRRLRVDPQYFFRMAHQWRFTKDAEVTRDVLEYKCAGIIPVYVREYVGHLQQEQRRT